MPLDRVCAAQCVILAQIHCFHMGGSFWGPHRYAACLWKGPHSRYTSLWVFSDPAPRSPRSLSQFVQPCGLTVSLGLNRPKLLVASPDSAIVLECSGGRDDGAGDGSGDVV